MYKYVNENYQELGFNKLYDDERIIYYPKSQAILYGQDDETALVKDYPFLKDYISDNHTMEHFIERTLRTSPDIRVYEEFIVDMDTVINMAIEEISDDQGIFARGEEAFEDFINKIMTDVAEGKLSVIIEQLESEHDIVIDLDNL